MRRAGRLYPLIAEPDNIRLAFLKAARGKHNRKEIVSFKSDFENNIRRLYDQIKHQLLDVGKYRFFHVYDPKKRLICAAAFEERVLHHAIMNVCEPVLDTYAIYDSYACRKGKGAQKAVLRSQEFAGRYLWFLKLDIRKYFDSIDHRILMQFLAHRFKDKTLLLLFGQIIKTYQTEADKGLPIGNLISQHLANFYLSGFDHWIKEVRRVHGYIRYMDDFILFKEDKASLKNELRQIQSFLKENLKLDLKSTTQLNRSSNGIPFLGLRVFPQRIRLSPLSKRRFIRKFRLYEENFKTGRWSINMLTRHMEPLIEFTQMANAADFRRNVMIRFGVSS
ncbi:MAG: reverse transcriptase/maturase family protein [Desulfobacterales bacterium]|nr:reverse transcriptase/maturase family protein [Desulfobacterales bacterium]